MKYYVYISDAKVDMLYPQVPHEIKKKVSLEFKTDIKIFAAARKVESENEENRITRLQCVVEFIRTYGSVGTVEQPDVYIQDTVPLRWGEYEGSGERAVVYFGGRSGNTCVGLGGSRRHVMGGSVGQAEAAAGSIKPLMVRTLIERLLKDNPDIDPQYASSSENHTLPFAALVQADKNLSMTGFGAADRMEFMAKRLLDSETDLSADERRSVLGEFDRAILGTPLYVAMLD